MNITLFNNHLVCNHKESDLFVRKPSKPLQINPPMTARVKISQTVDMLAMVYLVLLKVKYCQTLCVVRTLQVKMSRFLFTGKSIVWYC